MNDNGQFLLYDAFLAFILIVLVLISMLYIFNQEEDILPNNDNAIETLELLSSIRIHNTNVLIGLSENDMEAKRIVEDTLDGNYYLLRDLTENKTLLNNMSSGNVICSRKVIEGHEYELKIYSS